jgi:hypothetical protein
MFAYRFNSSSVCLWFGDTSPAISSFNAIYILITVRRAEIVELF